MTRPDTAAFRSEWVQAWQEYDAAVDRLMRYALLRARDDHDRCDMLLKHIARHAHERIETRETRAWARSWRRRRFELIPGGRR